MTLLPVTVTIFIEGENIGSIWPAWRKNWTQYYVACEMSIKKPTTTIAILLTILGSIGQKGDRLIKTLLNSFEKYIDQR